MSTMTRTQRAAPNFLTSTLPQVNLLPPEVRAARGLVHTKRWLMIALAFVVVLAALGFGAALYMKQVANTELADAQAETAQLKVAEAKYADVPLVLNDLTRSADARRLGMSTEILWKGYLDAVSAVLPPNVSIASFTVIQGSPAIAAPAPADRLAAQGAATVSFTTDVVTIPDNAAWLDALNSIPGFYGATVLSESLGTDRGTISYGVTSTVQVALSAYSGRFAATEGN